MIEGVRFDGRVVLVTGAGRGLGRAYARLLAERGAYVVLHDAGVSLNGTGANPSVADTAVNEIRQRGGTAIAAYENLASPDACRALVERALAELGGLDALVNNAGLVQFAGVEATDEAIWRQIMHVNLDAPFWLSRAAFPVMKRQGFGRIVMTVSGQGLDRDSSDDLTAYCVSKAGLFGLMNALAAEGTPHGIRVNAISPVAATRIYRRQVEPGELTPEQVAPGVVFLASPQCNVSGIVLRAGDGRFSAGQYVSGPSIDFGRTPTRPETIATRWKELVASAPGPARS